MGGEVHHKLKYFSLEHDSPMSKQLDMLVLFALDRIASEGIREYKKFIKQQLKLNSVLTAGSENNTSK